MRDGSKRFDLRILDLGERYNRKEIHLEVDTLGAPQHRGSMSEYQQWLQSWFEESCVKPAKP